MGGERGLVVERGLVGERWLVGERDGGRWQQQRPVARGDQAAQRRRKGGVAEPTGCFVLSRPRLEWSAPSGCSTRMEEQRHDEGWVPAESARAQAWRRPHKPAADVSH